MSKTDLRVILGVDGEAEFTAKMTKLKKQQAEINSEIRKNTSALSNTASAYDKAKINAEGLTKKIETQEEKVKLLKDAYEKSKNELGENADATIELKTKYQNAEAQLNKFKTALKEENAVLESTTKLTKTSAEKLEEFGNKAEKTGKDLTKAGNNMTKYFSTAILAAGAAAAKSSIEFEDAFAGVEKTVEVSEKDAYKLIELREDILDMSTRLPAAANEIAGVAEAAGQLGINVDDISSFTEVMIKLGMSTNLSAEEAASSLAKLANITGMSADNYDRLGATIVDLGNNYATTESDIVQMTTKLASTGAVVGYSETQMLAIATALSSVGIEADAGGSAFSKLSKRVALAVTKGGEDLKQWADIAGVSSAEFKKAYEKDALGALNMFIKGLNDTNRLGKSSIKILADMEIKEVRESNAVLALAKSNDILGSAIDTANKAWKDNNALTTEVAKRLETTGSKLALAKNELTKTAIVMGDNFLPVIADVAKSVGNVAEKFGELPATQQVTIAKFALIVAALGPTVSMFGKLTSGLGGTAKELSHIVKTVGSIKAGTYTGPLSNLLSKLIATKSATGELVTSSAGLAGVLGSGGPLIIGFAAAAAAGVALYAGYMKATEGSRHLTESVESLCSHFGNFDSDVANATNLLSGLNQEIIVSSEEQSKISSSIDTVQGEITAIAKRAAENRRQLTQGEIDRLNELFEKLRELSGKELENASAYQDAVRTMAEQADDFSRESSFNLIKTAEDTKSEVLELAKNQYTEKLLLAQQAFEQEGGITQAEYDRQKAAAKEEYDLAVNTAEQKFADTYSIITEGYYQQNIANDEQFQKLLSLNEEKIKADENYEEEKRRINENMSLDEAARASLLAKLWLDHQLEVDDIQDRMADSLDDLNQEELATWIEMSSNCEVYGGKMSQEAQTTSDNFLSAFENLPNKAKKKFKETMQGMLDGIKEKSGDLFKKATELGNGFINRIRKTFDINSPSKVMKQVFKHVVEGGEVGIDAEKPVLIKKGESLVDDFLASFEGKDISMNAELRASAEKFISSDFESRLAGLSSNIKAAKENLKNYSSETVSHISYDNSVTNKEEVNGGVVLFKVENMTVRNDADIRKISQQIETLARNMLIAKGIKI